VIDTIPRDSCLFVEAYFTFKIIVANAVSVILLLHKCLFCEFVLRFGDKRNEILNIGNGHTHRFFKTNYQLSLFFFQNNNSFMFNIGLMDKEAFVTTSRKK
jgi:hypothetical protein